MGRKAIRFGTRRKCRFSIGRRCTLPICYLLGISLDVLFIRFFLCFCGVFVINNVCEWVDEMMFFRECVWQSLCVDLVILWFSDTMTY